MPPLTGPRAAAGLAAVLTLSLAGCSSGGETVPLPDTTAVTPAAPVSTPPASVTPTSSPTGRPVRLDVPEEQPGEVSRTVFTREEQGSDRGNGTTVDTVRDAVGAPTDFVLQAACATSARGRTLAYRVEDAREKGGRGEGERNLLAGTVDCDGQRHTRPLSLDHLPVLVELDTDATVDAAYAVIAARP